MIDNFIDFIEEYLNIFLYIFPFITQVGIPVGLSFFAMLRGSFIVSFSEFIFVICFFSSMLVTGDLIAYFIGRKYNKKIIKLSNKNKKIKMQVDKVSNIISKNSFYAIFITRTLLLGLAPITNYLLGMKKFSLKKFLILVLFAEILYAIIFIGIGYVFSETWEYVLRLIEDFSYILIGVIVLYFLIKYLIKLFKS